jgi:hypothetical protein
LSNIYVTVLTEKGEGQRRTNQMIKELGKEYGTRETKLWKFMEKVQRLPVESKRIMLVNIFIKMLAQVFGTANSISIELSKSDQM